MFFRKYVSWLIPNINQPFEWLEELNTSQFSTIIYSSQSFNNHHCYACTVTSRSPAPSSANLTSCLVSKQSNRWLQEAIEVVVKSCISVQANTWDVWNKNKQEVAWLSAGQDSRELLPPQMSVTLLISHNTSSIL